MVILDVSAEILELIILNLGFEFSRIIIITIAYIFLMRASKSIEKAFEGFENPRYFLYIGILSIVLAILSLISRSMPLYYLWIINGSLEAFIIIQLFIIIAHLIIFIAYLIFMLLIGLRNRENHEGKYILYYFAWIFISGGISMLVSYIIFWMYASTGLYFWQLSLIISFFNALVGAWLFYLFAQKLPDKNIKIFSFLLVLVAIFGLIFNSLFSIFI